MLTWQLWNALHGARPQDTIHGDFLEGRHVVSKLFARLVDGCDRCHFFLLICCVAGARVWYGRDDSVESGCRQVVDRAINGETHRDRGNHRRAQVHSQTKPPQQTGNNQDRQNIRRQK